MAASTYQVIALAIYFVAMIAIGLWANSKNNSLDDYVLGGRQLSPTVAALSAGASDMSGWLLMGLPGAVYLSGLSQAWLAVGLTIGAWCNWKFVAPRLRSYTEVAGDAVTVPVFLSNRLHDTKRVLRIVSGVVILVFFTFYVSSGMVSGGLFFKSSFGQEYHTGMLLLAGITVFYTLFGGFMGASYTDMVQGLLMLAALIAVPVITIIDLGGVGPVVESISQVRPDALSIFAGTTFAGIVSSLAWGLGYFGQPHIIVRFMAMRTPADAKSGRRIGISWMVLTVFGALSGAFMGIAYFARHPEASLTNPETAESVFLDLSQILFHPFIAGLILAAVLAAIMSTLSSQLIVCSSALVEDLYGIFSSKKLSASKSLWLGRAGVAIVALVAGALAWNPNSSILQLVAFAWAGFGSAFGPTVLLSLYWRKLTTQGALASMITGAVVAFAWGQSPMKSVLYEMVPGFASAMLVAIIVSLVTYKKNPVIDEEFDRAVELAKVK
ncbi:sodium/proline symporter PutP [Rothia mucilaginosa]|uniref:sodium/proline symporter PutP n=1 Tax=Rothia mucilaginosa TaxID=43675 RepID=UPI001C58BD6D|nr:sodium/proline symporter PutP [Rothia mucilaginosa]QXW97976.1 sodium/proline symporter PutP [Rothia mucilaginosa]